MRSHFFGQSSLFTHTLAPAASRLIGSAKFRTEVTFDLTLMLFGRDFRGMILGDSICGQFIPQLIAYQQAGPFPIDKLIAYDPLEDIEEAVAASEAGQTVKPVLLS